MKTVITIYFISALFMAALLLQPDAGTHASSLDAEWTARHVDVWIMVAINILTLPFWPIWLARKWKKGRRQEVTERQPATETVACQYIDELFAQVHCMETSKKTTI